MRTLVLAAVLSVAAYGAADRVANWRADLELVRSTYSEKAYTVDSKRGISTRGQKDFDELYPKFKDQMTALVADVPQLSDAEITMRLMQVIAGANVAHNIVQLPSAGEFAFRVPLVFTWYADGVAVTGTDGRFAAALGARVLKIGTKTPEEILRLLAPYIAHENDVWLRREACEFLRRRPLLQVLGLAGAEGNIQLALAKPGGEVFTLDVPTLDDPLTGAARQRIPAPPLRRRGGTAYWHQYLADSKTLFIQYNACVNDPKLPFPDFARQVLADADAKAVKRVVIDLRGNGGGDSRVINPLKDGLRNRLNKSGSVYVLVRGSTFSSAAQNAMELRRELHAKLVGEAAGAKPSSYGEVKYIPLPNSKLTVQYASKWFGTHDNADALAPDIAAPQTRDDALAARDTALEKALTL